MQVSLIILAQQLLKFQLPIQDEQWRAGVLNRGAADRLDFQLSTDATSLTTGTWTDYDALDFNSPNMNTTLGAKDGILMRIEQ